MSVTLGVNSVKLPMVQTDRGLRGLSAYGRLGPKPLGVGTTLGTGITLGTTRGTLGSPGRPPIACRTWSVTACMAEVASGGIVAAGARLVAGSTPPADGVAAVSGAEAVAAIPAPAPGW